MFKLAEKSLILAAAFLLCVLAIDLLTPLGVAVGVLYVMAFYFATKASVKAILAFAVVSILFVLLKLILFVSPESGWMVFMNRGLSILVIVVVAVLAVRQRLLSERLDEIQASYIKVLRKKNERLQAYRHSLNLHLLLSVIDCYGLISYVNQPFCEASKYSRAELVGNSFFNVWDLHPDVKLEISQAIHSGLSWRGEIKSRAKDGTFYWSDTVIFPINDQGTVGEYFSISMPITERKKLEQEQAENIKTFETILWKVSHQLRAPIATCRGITHLLESEPAPHDIELQNRSLLHRKQCTSELDNFSKELMDILSRITQKSI